MQLNRSRRYRVAIENKTSIDQKVSMEKILYRSRKVLKSYQAERDSKEFGSMDQAIYREVSRRNPEISIEEACIKEVSSRYREGIKLSVEEPKEEFSRKRNNTR